MVQPSESVKQDLPGTVNMWPVGIQAAAPPTPVTTVQPQPVFMSSNLQSIQLDSARPGIVQDPVAGKVQMDMTDSTSLIGFVR